ncbi:MAG: transglycosylase SLT domain-containing protein [Candidatus Sericytochromatia bacterium]
MKKYLVMLCFVALTGCQQPLAEAEKLIQKRDFAQAERVLKNLAQSQEAPADTPLLLAQTAFYTQGPDVAISQLQALKSSHGDHPLYQSVTDDLAAEYARFDAVIQNPDPAALTSYLAANPIPYFAERGAWLQQQKDKNAANKLLNNPTEPLVVQLKAWDQAAAKPAALEELLDKYPNSRLRTAWYNSRLQAYPKPEEARLRGAILERWLQELPDQHPRKAVLLLQQADNLRKERPLQALNLYKTFLTQYPKHIAGRQAIYNVRNELEAVLRTNDHRWLAQAAWERDMYQTAYSELSKVPAQNVKDQLRLGQYALEAKYYPQARKHFENVQKSAKGSREAGLATVGLATLQRSSKNSSGAHNTLKQVRQAYGSQPEVMAAALWEEGVLHDLVNRDDLRAQAYSELVRIAPGDKQVLSALWFVIWEDYREGRYEAAIRQIEAQRTRLKGEIQESRFLYWLGRCYESLKNNDAAVALYTPMADGPLMDYYTHRARERLRVIKEGGEDRYATTGYAGHTTEALPRHSYANGFRAALEGDKEALSELMELAYLGQEDRIQSILPDEADSRYHVMHGLMLQKQGRYYEAVTRYRYPAETDNAYLPAAFPLAWFDTIQKEAQANQLNPFLVSGLIWQESQYKPDIKSWVGATGLMQIMPATGQQIAGEIGLKDFDLTQAETNIRMGSWYLRTRHETFDGNSMLAVASYNAGAGPVMRWKRDYGHLPYDALAESITYPETRGYVRRVFTSFWIYQSLYGQNKQEKPS